MIIQFNFHALDNPKTSEDFASLLGAYGHSGEQLLAAEFLYDDALRTLRQHKGARSLCASLGRRGALKLIDVLTAMKSDSAHCYDKDVKSWEKVAATVVAEGVVVDDLIHTVPVHAGQVHPEDFLKHGRADIFLDASSRVADPSPPPHTLPKGCSMIRPEDEPRIRQLLLERKVCCLIPESEIPEMYLVVFHFKAFSEFGTERGNV